MGKANNTRIGHKWELWAHKYLFSNSVLVTNQNRNASYDLDVDGTRINSKASKLYSKKHGKYFEFMIKRNTGCDYFLLIGYRYRNDKEPLKVWFIPAHLINNRRKLTIGPNHGGQWKQFERDFISRNELELMGVM
jgi:hypothetical protein